MVLNSSQEPLIVVDPNPGIPCNILPCDLSRTVGAAIVDDRAVPVLIGLSENTLHTLREELRVVVNGNYDAHQWRHGIFVSIPGTFKGPLNAPPGSRAGNFRQRVVLVRGDGGNSLPV